MSQRNPFAAESREKIVKSIVNWSNSKQLWTFPKKKRFKKIKPQCPHAFYQQKLDTFSNHKVNFTNSARRLFTDEAQMTPSPADYFQEDQKQSEGLSFGVSRDIQNFKFNSYIQLDLSKNPGPNKYEKYAFDQTQKSKRGYSLRPHTAKDRNYFIDNRQLKQVPGPSQYQYELKRKGDCKISKYRSVTLGGVGMMNTSSRFRQSTGKTPGPSLYEPKKKTRNASIGGRIGSSTRTSFIDKIIQSQKIPGPGDYQIPCQFGHYKKVDVRSRIATIQ